jgi:hypothetical protein
LASTPLAWQKRAMMSVDWYIWRHNKAVDIFRVVKEGDPERQTVMYVKEIDYLL